MIRRWVAACLSGALVLAGIPVASAQGVQPFPVSPTSPEVEQFWFGSDSRTGTSGGPLDLQLDSIAPRVADASETVTINVTLTNRTSDTISDLSLRTQRSEALPSSAQASLAMAEPETTYSTVTQFSDPVTLGPRASTTVPITVPLQAPAPEGLSVTSGGVYPILVNANGSAGDGILRQLAETRTLLPVRGGEEQEPLDDASDLTLPPTDQPDATIDDEEAAPRPLSMVWPITEPVPVVPGETGDAPESPELILSNNSLSESMSEGGRLNRMVTSLAEALDGPGGQELGFSTCIAIDPELVLAAKRMSSGYLIGGERSDPTSTGVRLRDSWTHNDGIDAEPASSEDTSAAGAWLNSLRDLTEGQCVISMPWANASASGVASLGDPDLTSIWLSGDSYLRDILDVEPVESVLLPPEGQLSARSVDTLAGTGTTTALVASTSVTAESQIQPGAAVELPHNLRAVTTPTDLSTTLAATGSDPSVAGYSRELGRHRLDIDSSVARMQTAVGTLHSELDDGGDGALFIIPPGDWSVDEADINEWFGAVLQTFADGRAAPTAFADAIGPIADAASAGPGNVSTSVTDPGEVTASEIGRATQQARYTSELTGLMVEEPDIALTPAGFTLPINRDILRSISVFGRNNAEEYDSAVARAREIQEHTGSMIQGLRESVRLITPGSRYTRATGASPVAVVAGNGLPLPVDATVVLDGDDMSSPLHEPTRIPARGSLTLQLYPDVDQADSRRSDLQVRLETPDGRAISAPVAITVQSGLGSGLFFVLTALFLLGAGIFARRRWQKLSQNAPRTRN